MAYKALVAHAQVRPHPDSDNGLKILNIQGYQVITGAAVEDGELMVFFPEGGVLSSDYLRVNNEYRSKLGLNANQAELVAQLHDRQLKDTDASYDSMPGGFFEANGRVRTIRLRGERSEGYTVKPEMLAYTGASVSDFYAGMTFNELNGHQVCWKYISPATQRAMNRLQKIGKKLRDYGLEMFHKHYDTENLRHGINSIPNGARVVITEKLHGTSGRTGYVLANDDVPETLWTKIKSWFGYVPEETQSWQHVTGTRQVVRYIGDKDIRNDLGGEDHKVRFEVHQDISRVLQKGETWYYEIIGHWDTGAPIFSHSIPEDDIGKKMWKRWKNLVSPDWGRHFHYTYGTTGNGYDVYVYRITQTNVDGQSIDLSWEQIQARVLGLGFKVVPELNQGIIKVIDGQRFYRSTSGSDDFDGAWVLLYEASEALGNGASTLDTRHTREGVCLRVEHPEQQKTFKYKGFEFCHLEGIMKNSDTYIDAEEVS